jgi:hypothetical protein
MIIVINIGILKYRFEMEEINYLYLLLGGWGVHGLKLAVYTVQLRT